MSGTQDGFQLIQSIAHNCHQRQRRGNLDDFLVSIDTIEALTGLDFFSAMDQSQQDELESIGTWKFWEDF